MVERDLRARQCLNFDSVEPIWRRQKSPERACGRPGRMCGDDRRTCVLQKHRCGGGRRICVFSPPPLRRPPPRVCFPPPHVRRPAPHRCFPPPQRLSGHSQARPDHFEVRAGRFASSPGRHNAWRESPFCKREPFQRKREPPCRGLVPLRLQQEPLVPKLMRSEGREKQFIETGSKRGDIRVQREVCWNH